MRVHKADHASCCNRVTF